MKLADKQINNQFGGGCPICKGDGTLTIGGSIFKRSVECTTCGSKFESCFGITSPKYKLVEGSSEHIGNELTLKEWSLVRADNRRGADVQPPKPKLGEITSEYSADVTRDKVTSIFKRFGFEVDKTGDEYHAHKGNFFTGSVIGLLLPRYDMYYSLSEVKGKTVVNLRAVGFWFVLEIYKQESIIKKIVAAISAELMHSETGASIDKTPIDDGVSGETHG